MKRWTLALVVAGVTGVSILLSAQQAAAPDIILTNGKIVTVDDRFSIAQAVAVRGDRFVAVGTNQDITRLAGPNTRRIDLRGRTVVPGMIDNHAHFQEEGAYWALELRFDGVDSRKQALELIRAKAKEKKPGEWVYNLGGWSPDQFADNKKPFTREELDQVAPDNPVFLQFTRSEQYLNSKAIEVLGLEKKNRAVDHARCQGPRDRHHRRGGPQRDRGRRQLPRRPQRRQGQPADGRDRRRARRSMLRDLAKAGLTASGGQCLWEDLYRQFQREGTASMRFFCFRTVTTGGRGAGALEKQIAELPTLRYHDGDEWMDNANYGERLPRRRRRRRHRSGPRADCVAGSVGRVGPFRPRRREGGHPGPAPHRDGEGHRRAAGSAREGQQGSRHQAASLGVHAHGRRDAAADRAHEEAQHVHRR